MQVRPFAADALLVECADLAQTMAVHAEALRRRVMARDLVPAARTVLFDGVLDREALAREILTWSVDTKDAASGDLVELRTLYDGPDLAAVAELWDMTTDEAVATHRGTEFTVAFCGFAPGFGYCTGLPERLSVPRLDSPRSSVPAGAVGLAAEFTGVYPSASPGGWQIIGHTTATLWDESREPPALLSPGTRVRFVDV
ncbi:MAG: allophanate hydrolase subunit 1 [Actinomycetota bacterium]|nr:allophanate hydrolase subunit 1 [Actinomycetota bacterium]